MGRADPPLPQVGWQATAASLWETVGIGKALQQKLLCPPRVKAGRAETARDFHGGHGRLSSLVQRSGSIQQIRLGWIGCSSGPARHSVGRAIALADGEGQDQPQHGSRG